METEDSIQVECQDTMGIIGLEGHEPQVDAPNLLAKPYELGFFNEDSLLHPELMGGQHGFAADPRPYTLGTDDYVTGSLLLCFLLMVYLFNKTRKQFLQQTHDFFLAPRDRKGLSAVTTTIEAHSALFIVLQLCVLGSILCYFFIGSTLNLTMCTVSPQMLMLMYCGCFLAYFTVKRILYSFVNWVYFEKIQQKQWKDSHSFLITVEAAVFLPLVLISVFLDADVIKMAWISVIFLVIHKILMLYKSYKIFFPKIHCIFHLFTYLCTLEMIPMLILGHFILLITDNLIIKN